jgi:hypothetical protein
MRILIHDVIIAIFTNFDERSSQDRGQRRVVQDVIKKVAYCKSFYASESFLFVAL